MKKYTVKKIMAFIPIIIGMFSFTLVNAQSCNGNRIWVFKCGRTGGCMSKCVNPNKIPTGWGLGCNCGFGLLQPESTNTDENASIDVQSDAGSNEATIPFSLLDPQNTSFNIYDLNGLLVWTLVENNLIAGANKLVWNTAGITDGIYFAKIQTRENLQTIKIIVTK